MLTQLYTAEELVGQTITALHILEYSEDYYSDRKNQLILKFNKTFAVFESSIGINSSEINFCVADIKITQDLVELGILSQKEYDQELAEQNEFKIEHVKNREIQQLKELQAKYPNIK